MRVHRSSVVVLAFFAISAGAVAAGVSRSDTKVYGETRADKALVYFFTASPTPQFLFADDTLLGPIDWKSYGFGYVDSGKHLIWTNGPFKWIEFLPGRTYYLCSSAYAILLIDEVQGRRVIELTRYFRTTTDEENAKAEKHIGKYYALLRRNVEKVYGEIRPDKALVYFIRPFEALEKTFIYVDGAFLGRVWSGSYGFGYVDPGKHLVWTNESGVSEELEFLGGRTYYLHVLEGFSLLREEEGRQLLEQIPFFKTTTDKEKAKAEKQAAHGYGTAKRREAEREKFEVETLPAPVPPVDVGERVRVPAGTDIRVELVENVSSAHSSLGETVWFRTTDDLIVSDTTVVRGGTLVPGKVRRTEGGHLGGRAGIIDLVIPAIPASDGTPVPTVGRLLMAGSSKTQEAVEWSAVPVPVIGIFGFFIRGGEAIAFLGDAYVVTTRTDVWVSAIPASPGTGSKSLQQELAGIVSLPVRAQKISYAPSKRGALKDIVFRMEGGRRIGNVALVEVDGRRLPVPVQAQDVSAGEGGTEFRFAGWSVVRYLRPREARAAAPVTLFGTFGDGTSFVSRLDLPVDLE